MSDIFLSYATEDRPRTRLLVQALEARGWTVWWDRTILPAEHWADVIEEALDAARCAIVLWSKTSVTSDWVRNEAEEATRRKILVPVLIDNVKVPFAFRGIQAARLVAWTGDTTEEEFGKLVQAIAKKVGEPVPPPLPPEQRGGPRWPRPAVLGGLGAIVAAVAIAVCLWTFYGGGPLVIGVMNIDGRGTVPAWMCENTRDALNTTLSRVDNLRAYSKHVIDLLHKKRGRTNFEAAQQLGITKVISGSISVSDQNLLLEIEIDDARGMIDYAEEIRGTGSRLIEMQNDAVKAILKVIKPELRQDQLQKLVANRSNEQLEGYKLLTESMGEVVEEKGKPAAPPVKPHGEETSWELGWPASAFAADPNEAEVKQLLERYRTALESKSMEQISAIYVEVTPSMRDALTRYFATADNLTVRFSNFDILIEGNEAVATFTRNDEFKDAHSGRDMQLEVRVSSVVAKQDGGWKIRGLRKPS